MRPTPSELDALLAFLSVLLSRGRPFGDDVIWMLFGPSPQQHVDHRVWRKVSPRRLQLEHDRARSVFVIAIAAEVP